MASGRSKGLSECEGAVHFHYLPTEGDGIRVEPVKGRRMDLSKALEGTNK